MLVRSDKQDVIDLLFVLPNDKNDMSDNLMIKLRSFLDLFWKKINVITTFDMFL